MSASFARHWKRAIRLCQQSNKFRFGLEGLLDRNITAAEGRLPSISVMSWLNLLSVTPESVWSKNDCGACKTVRNSVLWRPAPDFGVIRIYKMLLCPVVSIWRDAKAGTITYSRFRLAINSAIITERA